MYIGEARCVHSRQCMYLGEPRGINSGQAGPGLAATASRQPNLQRLLRGRGLFRGSGAPRAGFTRIRVDRPLHLNHWQPLTYLEPRCLISHVISRLEATQAKNVSLILPILPACVPACACMCLCVCGKSPGHTCAQKGIFLAGLSNMFLPARQDMCSTHV